MSKDCVQWQIDCFDDIRVLKYDVPGFEQLSLRQKSLIYYLSEAALWGRDILADHNFKYNLEIRSLLEDIVAHHSGKKTEQLLELEKYLKKVWFANGIHHHYSGDKFKAGFSAEYFKEMAQKEGVESSKIELLSEIIFNDKLYPIRCSHNQEEDLITTSANNYYEGVTQSEAEQFYKEKASKADDAARPPSLHL